MTQSITTYSNGLGGYSSHKIDTNYQDTFGVVIDTVISMTRYLESKPENAQNVIHQINWLFDLWASDKKLLKRQWKLFVSCVKKLNKLAHELGLKPL